MRRGRALKGAKRVEVELWWWGSRRGHRGSSELRGLEGMVCRVIRGSSKLVGLVVTGTGTDRLVDGRWGLGRELGKLHGAGNWLGKLGAEL
jgi:hypothetical protein